MGARTVVLVEGESDRLAVEALAVRLGDDLHAGGIDVVAMAGATNVRQFAADLAAHRLLGLCDVGEAALFERALGSTAVFVCDLDLEDELIRALGVDAVEAVIEQLGELRSLRTLQRQPAQMRRPVEAQLRRFFGSKGGRKIRYAAPLVDALDLDRVPAPLRGLLAAL